MPTGQAEPPARRSGAACGMHHAPYTQYHCHATIRRAAASTVAVLGQIRVSIVCDTNGTCCKLQLGGHAPAAACARGMVIIAAHGRCCTGVFLSWHNPAWDHGHAWLFHEPTIGSSMNPRLALPGRLVTGFHRLHWTSSTCLLPMYKASIGPAVCGM